MTLLFVAKVEMARVIIRAPRESDRAPGGEGFGCGPDEGLRRSGYVHQQREMPGRECSTLIPWNRHVGMRMRVGRRQRKQNLT